MYQYPITSEVSDPLCLFRSFPYGVSTIYSDSTCMCTLETPPKVQTIELRLSWKGELESTANVLDLCTPGIQFSSQGSTLLVSVVSVRVYSTIYSTIYSDSTCMCHWRLNQRCSNRAAFVLDSRKKDCRECTSIQLLLKSRIHSACLEKNFSIVEGGGGVSTVWIHRGYSYSRGI